MASKNCNCKGTQNFNISRTGARTLFSPDTLWQIHNELNAAHLPFVLAPLSATLWGLRSLSAPLAVRLPLCRLWADGFISIWLIRFPLHCHIVSLCMLSLVQNVHIARHGEYDEIQSEDLLCTGAYWFEILLRANRSSLDWFYKQNNSDGVLAFALWKVKSFCLYEQCEGVLFCYNKGWILAQTLCRKCIKCLFFCFRYNLSLTLNLPLCMRAYPQRWRCKCRKNFHKFASLKN